MIELLVWYGFLGVQDSVTDNVTYAYQVRYNTDKLMIDIERGTGGFYIHPAFHRALGVTS
jgi:hypothetical protein